MQIITDSDDTTVTCTNVDCMDFFEVDIEGLETDTPIKVECPGCGEMVEVMIQGEDWE